MGSEDGPPRVAKDPLLSAIKWCKARPVRDKVVLGTLAAFLTLFLLWWSIEDHDLLFLMAEGTHILGIGMLAVKMYKNRSVAGISLQSQLLTAMFLLARLLCSFLMEYDIHTVLDALALAGTGIIVFGFTFLREIRLSYQREADTIKFYFVLIPCCALAAFIYPPSTGHWLFLRVTWAFCVYLEAVSVLPQLKMMMSSKVVERFTAHYVFALGVSRYLNCAHWGLQVLNGEDVMTDWLGSGWWPIMVLVAEIVQTTILSGFCYCYVKAYTHGDGLVRLLPMNAVF